MRTDERIDDKDWTWVLDEVCPECGFAAWAFTREELPGKIRAVGGAWREMLGRGAVVHQPPHGDRTWTILEYGAHVRDVFDLFEDRMRLMLKKRKPPTFKDWNQERAAIDGNYAELDPAKVAYALASNAGKVADVLDRVRGDDWDKRGIRSDGVEFTVESIGRYLLHDVEHHLWDAHQIIDGE
ncbi:MAG: DinB family protein [Actinomycetota bacterium]